jgi:hypothetical protein
MSEWTVENPSPTFIITREDQVVDPVTLSTPALRVGRQIDCEILLNHPAVSRLNAGINEVEGRFYLINLSASNAVTLNGRLIEFNQPEALADGDVVQVGPFFLHMSRKGRALNIHVQFQVAASIAEEVGEESDEDHTLTPEAATSASPKVADALKEFWDKRTRDKAARPSPLHPRRLPIPGKAQFNWKPTRDLLRPWRVSIFIWAAIIIGAMSAAAAVWYTKAFSPGPVSQPHMQASLVHGTTAANAIAARPNAGSCTTCHAIRSSVEANCASCHQTEAFAASLTGIPTHALAGVGCVSCHTEHQGADFRPAEAALNMCAQCHRDGNQNLYRGRRVGTPHGGTVGYPVVNGRWMWAGLDEEEWKQKPDADTEGLKRARERMPAETDDQWRSRQFHVLHVQRVLVRDVKLAGNAEGEMSCSSCHKSFNPIDRVTPATTCALCHNGNNGPVARQGQRTLIAADAPNCTSCHVQHLKEPGHWNPALLAPAARRAEDERRFSHGVTAYQQPNSRSDDISVAHGSRRGLRLNQQSRTLEEGDIK